MDQTYALRVFLVYLLYMAEWYGEQKGIQKNKANKKSAK